MKFLLAFLVMTLSFPIMGVVSKRLSSEKFALEYRIQLPKPLSERKIVRLWVPMPVNTMDQRVAGFKIESQVSYQVTQEPQFGNKMVYMEVPAEVKYPVEIQIEYEIERRVGSVLPMRELLGNPLWSPSFYKRGQVRVSKQILALASRYQANKGNETQRIDSIFEFLKAQSPVSDCRSNLDLLAKIGESSDLAIRREQGLVRSAEGKVFADCWARIFDPNKGWVPISGRRKENGWQMSFLGWMASNRVHLTTGKGFVLSPRPKSRGPKSFVFPFAEADGREFNKFVVSAQMTQQQ